MRFENVLEITSDWKIVMESIIGFNHLLLMKHSYKFRKVAFHNYLEGL